MHFTFIRRFGIIHFMQRLDKTLSEVGIASRKELKNLIKRGQVSVNGAVVDNSDFKVDPQNDVIEIDGERIPLMRRIVGILNKPAGYVTSTEDPRDPTVMSLIPEEYKSFNLVPAGRLDKDTEGLLIMTNDGDLIHRLISPKRQVEKVYYAEHEGIVSEDDIEAFAKGITLKDGTECKPAVLEIVDYNSCNITLTEGKYHQVRRMMASRGLYVTYLKRIKEDGIELGDIKKGGFLEIKGIL